MTRPVRVCHVSTMTAWGGVERMLVDLLTGPVGSEVTHRLLASSFKDEVVRPVIDAGTDTYLMQRAGRFDISALGRAAAWLRANQIDIIHSYNAYANIWGLMLSRLAGCRLLTSEHGLVWQTGGSLFQLDRLAQRSAAGVIANSAASARMLTLRYGIPSERLHVVRNGVAPLPLVDRTAVRDSLGVPPGLVVGSVGRLDTPKGFPVLVDAAARVLAVRQDLHFVLVGGGVLEPALRAQIESLGIDEHFTLTGWRTDARELMQAFDIFVSTSLRESSGNALVEAGLAGLPVIGPAIDGIPEVVIDEHNGLLLRPTRPVPPTSTPGAAAPNRFSLIDNDLSSPMMLDPDTLAAAILDLVDAPARRQQMGGAGKARAEGEFSLAHYRASLEAIYTAEAPR